LSEEANCNSKTKAPTDARSKKGGQIGVIEKMKCKKLKERFFSPDIRG